MVDVTPDVTQTAKWRRTLFSGEMQMQAQACVNISIHACCQREVLIRILFPSKNGERHSRNEEHVFTGEAEGKHVLGVADSRLQHGCSQVTVGTEVPSKTKAFHCH